jgi:hypothetical protein
VNVRSTVSDEAPIRVFQTAGSPGPAPEGWSLVVRLASNIHLACNTGMSQRSEQSRLRRLRSRTWDSQGDTGGRAAATRRRPCSRSHGRTVRRPKLSRHSTGTGDRHRAPTPLLRTNRSERAPRNFCGQLGPWISVSRAIWPRPVVALELLESSPPPSSGSPLRVAMRSPALGALTTSSHKRRASTGDATVGRKSARIFRGTQKRARSPTSGPTILRLSCLLSQGRDVMSGDQDSSWFAVGRSALAVATIHLPGGRCT